MGIIIWNNLEKKGELNMLQVLQTGKVLYALAAICALGIISKLLTSSLYKRLIKETGNMALTKNKNLKTLKQKTENVFLINHGIRNTTAYIEKQIYGFRFLKISLDSWDNFSMQAMILCFLTGGIAAFASYWYRCDSYYIVLYGAMGILSGLFMIFVDNGANVSAKRQQLSDCLVDYVENSPHFYRAVDRAEDAAEAEKKEKLSILKPTKAKVREIRREEGKAGKEQIERMSGEAEPFLDGDSEDEDKGRKGLLQSEREKAGQKKDGKQLAERSGGRFSLLSRKKDGEREFASANGNAEMTAMENGDELEKSIRYLKESLEQIAASREADRKDGLKTQDKQSGDKAKRTLHPEELKLLGEILQEYFS